MPSALKSLIQMPQISKKYRLLLICLLAILLAGGFFVWQIKIASSAPTPSPTMTKEQMEAAAAEKLKAQYNPVGSLVKTAISKGGSAVAGAVVSTTLEGMAELVGKLMFIVFTFLSWFVHLAARILEAIFQIEQFRNITIVETGWNITRGLCNMFFALILLIMSFATILQIEEFGAKKLLWKLTVSILLINFSLVIAGVVIDFSQILTHYFIDAAGGLNGSISEQLANGLNISRLYQAPGSVEEVGQQIAANANGLISVAGGLFFGIIIMLLALFALLAGAVFLVFRVVVLWVLLIAAPLAWLSRVFGGSLGKFGQFWGEWWSEFFRWTFFAPAYAFFIYLATVAIGSGGFEKAFKVTQNIAVDKGFFSGILSNIQFLMQYIVVVIFLILGILSAQKLGGAAGGAMSAVSKKLQTWGKKGVGAEQGFGFLARRTLGRPFSAAYDKYASKAVGLAGRVPLLPQKTRYRLQAKATQMAEEKPMEHRWHQDYAKKLKSMTEEGVLYETKHAFGIRKLLAAREAKTRGFLGRTEDKEAVEEAIKTLHAYGVKDDEGKTNEGKDLERLRVDVAADIIKKTLPEDKQEAAIQKLFRKSKDTGNLAKLHKNLFKKDATVFEGVLKSFTPPEVIEIFNSWGKETKEAAKKAMEGAFAGATSFDTKKINDLRARYADVTGDIHKAYGKISVLAQKGNEVLDSLAKEYVKQMAPRQIGNIRGDDEDTVNSLMVIGHHISEAQVRSVRGELSAFQKAIIKENSSDKDVLNFIENSPAWGGKEKSLIKTYSTGASVPPPNQRRA